jgi:hypothetical protein
MTEFAVPKKEFEEFTGKDPSERWTVVDVDGDGKVGAADQFKPPAHLDPERRIRTFADHDVQEVRAQFIRTEYIDKPYAQTFTLQQAIKEASSKNKPAPGPKPADGSPVPAIPTVTEVLGSIQQLIKQTEGVANDTELPAQILSDGHVVMGRLKGLLAVPDKNVAYIKDGLKEFQIAIKIKSDNPLAWKNYGLAWLAASDQSPRLLRGIIASKLGVKSLTTELHSSLPSIAALENDADCQVLTVAICKNLEKNRELKPAEKALGAKAQARVEVLRANPETKKAVLDAEAEYRRYL